jgi:hypothetical protein
MGGGYDGGEFDCLVFIVMLHHSTLMLMWFSTAQATQRALLKSATNSGFIARQVAASKARFKELTVPELR